jgi:hypothetical protein
MNADQEEKAKTFETQRNGGEAIFTTEARRHGENL